MGNLLPLTVRGEPINEEQRMQLSELVVRVNARFCHSGSCSSSDQNEHRAMIPIEVRPTEFPFELSSIKTIVEGVNIRRAGKMPE